MINREIYRKDPASQKLVNEGVASVNDDKTVQALAVLRYELETFVCDGQYKSGMSAILDAYLKNIDQLQQPGVWVSGFYGSGKSHLVKVLRSLWVDQVFEDGATARGITNLPEDIRDQLKELSTQAKRHGGLHSVSGTLGAGARGSVRLALLRLIFKSTGLPEQYPVARFIMWLKHEEIYDQVRTYVEQNSLNWDEELDNFYVAEGLHEALVQAKPQLFSSPASCVETLNNLYPYVEDVSSDEMLKAIRQALTRDGKLPLTLVVLDEVQQFIGENFDRADAIREVTEACSKGVGGKLQFIGTGQSAVSGTANLRHLMGRFTIPVELDDGDVANVIRQVILAKKPGAITPIETMMQSNLGEISRHLSGTTIGHQQDDLTCFSQDYPILPVRRRFWENTLRVLDQSGTDSQLRNQLSMIHKVIKTNLDLPLGNVAPGDYLYFDSADKLLRARILPRKVYERTITWSKGTEDDQLMARACGLVFLVNKLGGGNDEIGIKATVDTLADLLVQDLSEGSSKLRGQLPSLLDGCELLMKVGDEYRIQTEESAAWSDEYLSQRSLLANEAHRIDAERNDRIRKRFGETVRNRSLTHGSAKVSRDTFPVFDAQLPKDADKKIYIWVRDGWSIDENSVRAEARQAGNQSPSVFVYLPKRSADELRHNLIDYKASSATLDKRGVPSSPEGTEARAAMETTKLTAEGKVREFLDESLDGARVFQGGGNEILGNNLQDIILESANNSLKRLFPHFHTADNAGWAKAYENAKKGAPDALKAVGYDGEPAQNQACKALLACVAGGKKGADIRDQFESPPYGWSRDAVDGGLQVLVVAGLLRVLDERGRAVNPVELERRSIGQVIFKVESANVSAAQRIQIRKLFQKAGLTTKQGEELVDVPSFLQKMLEMAENAGGETPKPKRPDTKFVDEIRVTAGNEQLLALYNRRDEITGCIDTWRELDDRISKSWKNWIMLSQLLQSASTIEDIEIIQAQVDTIEDRRQLLEDPDLIQPLVASLTQLLRDQLNALENQYSSRHKRGMVLLDADSSWKKLEPEQRNSLLSTQNLTAACAPDIKVASTQEILDTLEKFTLSALADRVAAMPARFQTILIAAAEEMEPEAQFVSPPKRTIRADQDVETWLNDARQEIETALQKGPVIIH